MQKVVSINIDLRAQNANLAFSEHEFPEVNKYLEQGYRVLNFHQISPPQAIYFVIMTFILEKPNR